MQTLILLSFLLGQAALTPEDQAREDAKTAERARQQQELEDAQKAADAAEEARRKKCGRDYMRVKAGMKFERVEMCSGPFTIRYTDGTARVYEAAGGVVRVEHGRVTRVVYR